MQIDDTDRKILSELQANGRLSNAELSERVGMSQSACFRRVKQLEEADVITGYTAIVDRRKVGLNLSTFVIVAMEKHAETTLDDFMAEVNRTPEIVECHAVSGAGDYILRIVAADMDAFAQIALHRLVRLPGVKEISSSFILTSPKPSAPLPISS